jgi:dihydroorotate dehydrogenase (fumarate)
MHSLFEEQITNAADRGILSHRELRRVVRRGRLLFPGMEDYALGPDRYLEQISRIKERCEIPVIGSLNGISLGGWTDHAKLIEQAGADALELNVYYIATDPDEPGSIRGKPHTGHPPGGQGRREHPGRGEALAVLLVARPFRQTTRSLGADGVVLFNRFYQPDIDIEELEAAHRLELSNSTELRLRLRWAAILHGHLKAVSH